MRAVAVTDWEAVMAQDFAVPGGQAVPDLAEELCTMLASPDPAVRDDTAYPVLAIWTGRGVLDGQLGTLGGRLADRMRQGQIYERTFAAMTLSWVILRDVRTGELDDQAVRRWLAAFALWWPQEKDVRGWDTELGWLHAVAHGADTLRAFARSPRLALPDLRGLLELAVDRLLTDDGYLFAHGEDDRVAYALATVLTRAELPAVDATRWLRRVRTAIENGVPGPVPPWAANTLRTLAALYVFADRGVRWYEPHTGALGAAVPLPHTEQVKEAIAATLCLPWRGLG
jgi:Protein of unknown function (DUF2785)